MSTDFSLSLGVTQAVLDALAGEGGGGGGGPLDPLLEAIAALSVAADQVIYTTGPDAVALTGLTAFARSLLAAVDDTAARTTLNLEPGVDVQAHSAVLDATTAAFTAALLSKLDGIQDGATDDQTGTEIKALYEAEANAFTDALFTKLAGIQAGATDDQTGAEIKALYEAEADTNAYTDAAVAKLAWLTVTQSVDLDAIETRVNALDAAVVLVDEWDASTGSFPGGGTAQRGESWIVSVAGTVDSVAFEVDDRVIAVADNASTGTFAGNWHKADYSDLVQSVVGLSGAVTAAQILTALLAEPDNNRFDDAAVAKLAGIQAGATDDQTGAEIKAAYEAEADTNAYTDAEQAKLAGITAHKTNLNATADPTATADTAAGYTVGSRWVNVTADTEWVCLDATAAAAVWKETTAAGGAGGGIAETLIEAAGDLIVGIADNTAGRIAVGPDGQMPIADSAETGGIRWTDAVTVDPGTLTDGALLEYDSAGTTVVDATEAALRSLAATLAAGLAVNGQKITGLGSASDVGDAATFAQTWTWRSVDTKTAAYTITAGDAGKLLVMDGTFDFTIPTNASEAIGIGAQIGLLAISGTVNVVDSAGVTVNGNAADGFSAAMTNHQIVVATKLGADDWNVSGV